MRAGWVCLVVSVVTGTVWAQGPAMSLGGGNGDRSPFGYSATWLPARDVANQATDFTVVRQQLNAGFPIYMADNDRVLGIFSARHSLFVTDAVLPESRRDFPTSLAAIQVGTLYSHTFANQWQLTGILSVASASDIPFHGLREINPTVIGSLVVPTEGGDAWQFSLFYAPMGQFLFPLPGIAYRWIADDTLQMNLGIPFSLAWRPWDDLAFDLSYSPLTNVRARATWTFAAPWNVYAGYEWANDTFALVDRAKKHERFYADEMRLEAGLSGEIIERWRVSVFGGYAFNRRYWRGENFFSNRQDQLRIDPGPYLGARLEFRF